MTHSTRKPPPFRYGDDYPWNPDLDHEETLEIMRQLGLPQDGRRLFPVGEVEPRHRESILTIGPENHQ
jgi:hypothetical protein